MGCRLALRIPGYVIGNRSSCTNSRSKFGSSQSMSCWLATFGCKSWYRIDSYYG